MITDQQTNLLYLADTLPQKHSVFYNRFESLLVKHEIEIRLLPETNDIWAVDYMPIQISKETFVQFVYNPDYLRNYKKWKRTISDVDRICNALNLIADKSD